MNKYSQASTAGVDCDLAPWRLRGLGVLRILFGLIWAVDAYFWQPAFTSSVASYLTGSLHGQLALVRSWTDFWIRAVNVNPHVFAYLVAIGETALALGLILGLFSNLTDLVGVLLAFIIWSTAEGFGGPYTPGSTDIGASVIYILVFLGFYLSRAGLWLDLDSCLTPRLGRWSWVASR